jgi:hypothetical protein
LKSQGSAQLLVDPVYYQGRIQAELVD